MISTQILIVDDDPAVQSIIAQALETLGYSSRIASDGFEALDCLADKTYDIIIADISLPPINGSSFLQKARERFPESIFIILSGYAEEYTYERVIEAGAKEFIRKPFTLKELRSRLERVLHELELQREIERLLKEHKQLNTKLAKILAVANDLSSELDFDRLFPLIIHRVSEAMDAERTSLYIIDWARNEIWTKVAEQVAEIRLPLGQGISGRVAETGETLNIRDAWDLPYYNREFDQRHNFRTKSVLCLPINNRSGERIAVIQAINKIGAEQFSTDDETLLKGLGAQVAIALENAFLIEEIAISFESSIRTLSATVDAKHPLTAGHSQRVTEYALMIAQALGLDKQEQKVIKYAALLHDIGKIGIQDRVLLKDGPFTPEERDEMNQHPIKTRTILDKFHFPQDLQQVSEIAAAHHERINGQGYPHGLTDAEIPLGAKILAVADVFDALTSSRDYPKYVGKTKMDNSALSLPDALAILKKGSGSEFSPQVVEAFMKILPQVLRKYRGTHFPPEYVDESLRLYVEADLK